MVYLNRDSIVVLGDKTYAILFVCFASKEAYLLAAPGLRTATSRNDPAALGWGLKCGVVQDASMIIQKATSK